MRAVVAWSALILSACTSRTAVEQRPVGAACTRDGHCDSGACRDSTCCAPWIGPLVTVTSAPPAATLEVEATFRFDVHRGLSCGAQRLECSLDSGPFATCTSPHTIKDLRPGEHILEVRAVDVLAAEFPAITHAWRIDAGALDPTFGEGGAATIDLGGDARVYGVWVQPDKKIVVFGTLLKDTHYDFLVARFDADGALDPTFAGSGWQAVNIGELDMATCAAVQSGDRLVVAGNTGSEGGRRPAWTRVYLAGDSAGEVDPSFSNGIIDAFAEDVFVGGVHPLGDDSLVAVITRVGVGLVVARFTANGVLDEQAIPPAGYAEVSYAGPGDGKPFVVQSGLLSDETLLAGDSLLGCSVVRLSLLGGLVTFFGAGDSDNVDGVANAGLVDPGYDSRCLGSPVAAADGSFFAGGLRQGLGEIEGTEQALVVKLDALGSVDTSFGGGTGFVAVAGSSGLGEDEVAQLMVLSCGKVLVLQSYNENDGTWHWGLFRLLADGTIDSTFGGPQNRIDVDLDTPSSVSTPWVASRMGLSGDGAVIVGATQQKGDYQQILLTKVLLD